MPRLIKAPLHPPRRFSLCRGPEAPRRPIAGEGLCERPPPERRSPEAALGRGQCGENTIPSPTPSPSDVTRATSRGSRGPSPPSPFSSPHPPPAWRALGRCDSADLGHRQRWGCGGGRVGEKRVAHPEKTEAQLPPPGAQSSGPGQPQLPAALRQRASRCNRIQRSSDCEPRRKRGRRGHARGARGDGRGWQGAEARRQRFRVSRGETSAPHSGGSGSRRPGRPPKARPSGNPPATALPKQVWGGEARVPAKLLPGTDFLLQNKIRPPAVSLPDIFLASQSYPPGLPS